MRTCKIDGCNGKYEALGLCQKHYRASRPRKPDAKIELPCDGCGKPVLKEKRARRYDTVQCSDWVCRRWLTFGTASASPMPADHMALVIGRSCEWSAPKAKQDHTCAWCGDAFTSWQSTARYCSERCTRKRSKVDRRAREYAAPGTYTWAEVVRLWVAFDQCCAYCAKPTPLAAIQAEHVIALSRGGRNDLSNLLPSCLLCNSDKCAMSLDAWSEARKAQGKPPVTTTWTWSDTRYRHLSMPLRAA